jgi:hypothetical protein
MKIVKHRNLFKSLIVAPITAAAFFMVSLHGGVCGIHANELASSDYSVMAHSKATCPCECHTTGGSDVDIHITVISAVKVQFLESACASVGDVKEFYHSCRFGQVAFPDIPLPAVSVNLRI